MGKRENKIERYLDDEMKRFGGGTFKITGERGLPDRAVACWNAEKTECRTWLVEVKTADGVVSTGQSKRIQSLNRQGFRAVPPVFSFEGVDKFIREEVAPFAGGVWWI